MESPTHKQAKSILCVYMNERTSALNIICRCSICGNNWDEQLDILNKDCFAQMELLYGTDNRRADIGVYNNNNKCLEYVFEICQSNPTNPKNREGTSWFEFDALDILLNTSFTKKLVCKRQDRKCSNCFLDNLPNKSGVIYANNFGAGNGKTFHAVQLMNDIIFQDITTFYYLSKTRSACDTIHAELIECFNKNCFGDIQKVEDSRVGNHRELLFYKPQQEIYIRVLISTADSFIYALRDTINGKRYGGTSMFNDILSDLIGDGVINIGTDNRFMYVRRRRNINEKALIVPDESQDLPKEYGDLFKKLAEKTGVSVYLMGDILQSIIEEDNLFTQIFSGPETETIKQRKGENKVRRFKHTGLKDFVNSIVDFEGFNCPKITGVSDEPEPILHCVPIDFIKMPNLFKVKEDQIEPVISNIINDMKTKQKLHMFLPYDFCFIFPIVSSKNNYLNILEHEIQCFWMSVFRNPDSYTESFIGGLQKCMSCTKDGKIFNTYEDILINKEKHTTIYNYVQLHRSENGQPLDIDSSKYKTRIMSITASKGTGCNCVYTLGLSQFNIECFKTSPGKLKYESFIHVALTRAKMYQVVGYEIDASDDICRRFNSHFKVDETIKVPLIRAGINIDIIISQMKCMGIINDIIKIKNIIAEINNIKPADKPVIEWGDHIVRYSLMLLRVFLCLLKNTKYSHLNCLTDTLASDYKSSIIYVNEREYSHKYYNLVKDVGHNMNGKNKKKLCIPIINHSNVEYSSINKFIKDDVDSVNLKLSCLMSCIKKNDISKRNDWDFLSYTPMESFMFQYLTELANKPLNTNITNQMIIAMYESFTQIDSNTLKTHYNKLFETFDNILNIFIEQCSISTFEMKHSKKHTLSYIYCTPLFSGETDNSHIFIDIVPEMHTMNADTKLIKCLFTALILKLKNPDKKIIGVILTLNLPHPIIIDFTDILFEFEITLKTLLFTETFNHYVKNNEKIVEYYYCKTKDDNYIKSLDELIENINNKDCDESKWPDYVKTALTSLGAEKIISKKLLRKNLSNKEYIFNKLNNTCKYELLKVFKLDNDNDSDDDEY